jgi:glucose-1-phosphate cytidylyltransferase
MDYLDEDANCILEQGPLNQLAQDGKLMAYHHEGFFYAMDTYREYLALNELWEQGNAPWKIWKNGKVYHV